MPYVDGFLVPVPKKKVEAYRRMAQKAGRVWRKHGALEFRECVGDDLKVKMGVAVFPGPAQAGRDGDVFVDRLQVAGASGSCQRQSDEGPTLAKMMDPKSMPFDVKRMVYGGFRTIVDL